MEGENGHILEFLPTEAMGNHGLLTKASKG